MWGAWEKDVERREKRYEVTGEKMWGTGKKDMGRQGKRCGAPGKKMWGTGKKDLGCNENRLGTLIYFKPLSTIIYLHCFMHH